MKKIFLISFILLSGFCSVIAQNSVTVTLHQNMKSYSQPGPAENGTLRTRLTDINPLLQTPSGLSKGDTILLDLFPDAEFKACVEQISVDVNGTCLLRASITGHSYAYCCISTWQGRSMVTITLPESAREFRIRYDHDLQSYVLSQTDLSVNPPLEGGESIVPAEDQPEQRIPDYDPGTMDGQSNNDLLRMPQETNTAFRSSDGELNPETATVMIVYTPAAAAWALANETNINNTISLLMSNANLVLANSETFLQLQLVYSGEVNYVELNTNQDLYNLRDNGDGIMDTVHTLRDAYCADIVVLLEQISFTGGLGYLLSNPSGSPTYAFSLTRVQQASGTSYTTIHEIGHNMGCHHHVDQNTQPGPGLYTYSAGSRWTGLSNAKYCSVMTYTSGSYFLDGVTHSRLPYFSNPNIQYQGIDVGDSVTADNARTIRQVKSAVAAYRTGCCVQPLAQSSVFSNPSKTNTTADISWTRGDGDSVLVIARQGAAVSATPNTGSAYFDSPVFGSGSQLGTGNFVVYSGSGSSVTITGLTAGTTYHFAVYEYNAPDYCYKANPLTGNLTTLLTGPPLAGSAASGDTICAGTTTAMVLSGSSGNIQWQQSPDGIGSWVNVIGGSGATTANYTTAALAVTTYYRAQVVQTGYSPVWSNTLCILVNPLPGAATSVSADFTEVCSGASATLSYSGGSGNSFNWFMSSCGGSPAGSGNGLMVTPASTTTYYGRWENDCGVSVCRNITITVILPYLQTQNVSVCYGDSYTFPDGSVQNNITSAVSHTSYLQTVGTLCDSNIVTNISIQTVDTSVVQTGVVLTAGAAAASWQWLDCNNAMAAIGGANTQVYTATSNGSYAVAVTQGGCTDTSSCFLVTTVGMHDSENSGISVFPNPFNHELIIQAGNADHEYAYTLMNELGQCVMKGLFRIQTILRTSEIPAGVYMLRISGISGSPVLTRKFVKD